MKRKFLFLAVLLLGFLIPVKTLGLSGDISFSCNSTTVNVGDEVRCKIVGYSDGQISEIFSNLTSDGNIIVTNFKAERIWKINSEWPNLSLTSADKYPGNFEVGTVYLKAVASGVGTFYMNGTTFTGENGEVFNVSNKSVIINVISNNPTPVPTPDPTPVEPVKSNDATLKSLIVNDIDINFNPTINEYNIEVGSNINAVKIEAVANNQKAVVKIPSNLSLVTGLNQFLIEITAEDGTILNYKINVNKLEKLLSSNALLSDIKINGYDLKFSSDVFEYNIGTIKSNYLDISAVTEDSSATVVIIGNNNIGKDDSIIIKVTSESGNVKKYIIYASYTGSTVEIKDNDLLLTIVSGLFLFSALLVLILVISRKKKNKRKVVDNTLRAALDKETMKHNNQVQAIPLQLKKIERVKEEEYEIKKSREEKLKADKKKAREALEKIKRDKKEQDRLEKERLKREREEKIKAEKERALLEKKEQEEARILSEERRREEKEKAFREKEEREKQKRELEEKLKAERQLKIEQEKAMKERLKEERIAKLQEEKEKEEQLRIEREKEKQDKIQREKEKKELEIKAKEERERQRKIAEEQAKAERERQKKLAEEQAKAEKERQKKLAEEQAQAEKERKKLEEEENRKLQEEKEKISLIENKKKEEQDDKNIEDNTISVGEKISSEKVQETVKVIPKEESVTIEDNKSDTNKLDVSKEKTHTAVVDEKKQVEYDAKDIGAPEVSRVVNTAPSTPVVVEEEPEVLDMNVTVISPEQVLSAVKTETKKEEIKVNNPKNKKKNKK